MSLHQKQAGKTPVFMIRHADSYRLLFYYIPDNFFKLHPFGCRWARQESDLRPNDYESSALTTAPRALAKIIA